jgi:hypothetical protein
VSFAARDRHDREHVRALRAPLIVLSAVVAMGVSGIAWVIASPERPPSSARRCEDAMRTVRADPSTRLVVGEQGVASLATLAANAFFLRRHDASLVEALETEVHPGRAAVLLYDACAAHALLAIGDDADVPRDHAWHEVTLRPTADPFVVSIEPR